MRADASGDPKQMMAALNQAWTEFKSQNDEAMKALRKGQEDVVRADALAKIEATVGNLQAALDAQATQMTALQMGGPGTDGRRLTPSTANPSARISARVTCRRR